MEPSHRVISEDRVHSLFVTLYFCQPEVYVQLLSLILILILLFYILVSIGLVYFGLFASLNERKSNCFLS